MQDGALYTATCAVALAFQSQRYNMTELLLQIPFPNTASE